MIREAHLSGAVLETRVDMGAPIDVAPGVTFDLWTERMLQQILLWTRLKNI